MSWKIQAVVALLLVLSCVLVYGDEKRDKAIESFIAKRKVEVVELESKYLAAKKGRITRKVKSSEYKSGKYEFPSRVFQANTVAELGMELAEISSIGYLPTEQPEVGSIGRLWHHEFTVRQVIGKSQALCEISYYYARPGVRGGVSVKFPVLINIDTTDMIDDQVVEKFSTPVLVSRTQTYQTLGGYKTFAVLEPLTEAEVKKIADGIKPAAN